MSLQQHEVTGPVELLNEQGHIIQEGWARQLHWKYDRQKIKAPWHRIKEWDYYYVTSMNRPYAITFTMADLSYVGMCAVAWLDLNEGSFCQLDTLGILPRGKTGFPASSRAGNVHFRDKKISLDYQVKGGERLIRIDAPAFQNQHGRGLSGELSLGYDPAHDSMCIATSWAENRQAFYLNQKINCMPVRGTIRIGQNDFVFEPADSFGGLDWGRGNWTYKNRWYWGSASGLLNGVPFGWNIGYGFSDRSPASENMVFYNHQAHKLSEVRFHIPEGNYMAPWKFTSDDGRFEMDFAPQVDRNSSLNLGLIKSIQHQVFGHFSGRVRLDNGQDLKVERFLGFAEDVLNWW